MLYASAGRAKILWQSLVQSFNIPKYGVVASQKLWLVARTQIGSSIQPLQMVGARGANQTLQAHFEIIVPPAVPSTGYNRKVDRNSKVRELRYI